MKSKRIDVKQIWMMAIGAQAAKARRGKMQTPSRNKLDKQNVWNIKNEIKKQHQLCKQATR